MTADELKQILSGPAALFAVMMFASLLSMVKQVAEARRNGGSMTCAEYLAHWPETVATLGGNVVMWCVLLLCDQLNFASAAGVGYGMNSLADLIRPGGRSAALVPK